MSQSLIFLIPALIYIALRTIFWFNAFPNPDEAYYWLWGQHPDLSYYDHPPLLAWVQGIFTHILGQSFFTLRSPNLASNCVFFYTYFLIAKYLYRGIAKPRLWQYFGAIALAIVSSPLYFVMLSLAWHDHLMMTLSLVSAYLMVTFLDGYAQNGKGTNWRLYCAAIAIALACLAKYNALFMGLGFIAAIATSPKHRPLFRDSRFYLSVAIAIGGFLPVLLWNFGNDFQSLRFYLSRSVDAGTPLMRLTEPIGFLLLSVVMVSPVNSWLLWQGWRRFPISLEKPSRSGGIPTQQGLPSDSIYRSLAGWTFAIGTGLLTGISFFSTALYYWNITAYLLLFPLIPSVLFEAQGSAVEPILKGTAKRLFMGGQAYGLLFATLLVINYSFIPIAALLSPDADQESRIVFGWNQVAPAIQQASNQNLAKTPFLATTDYRSASLLAYQLKDRQVTAISQRVSQFTLWNLQQERMGQDAIVLSDDWYPLTATVKSKFARMSESQTVPVSLFGIWLKNYYLTKGYGFKGF
ncbi:glycosyltransferase family 39 protein [Tumidithrix helvetica PCC 7403]|uniref:glycosyltransferase family 39 protein n=1 Tax=Tumidithrix helvetica TaxID=3457545 RepID=UPI003C883228